MLPDVPGNARLHAGWFDDTLPAFFAAHAGPIRLLHVDCDLPAPAASVLAHAGDRIGPGTVVVFGNLIGHPDGAGHELRAWREFAQARGLRWRVLTGTLLGREVALRVEDGAA